MPRFDNQKITARSKLTFDEQVTEALNGASKEGKEVVGFYVWAEATRSEKTRQLIVTTNCIINFVSAE